MANKFPFEFLKKKTSTFPNKAMLQCASAMLFLYCVVVFSAEFVCGALTYSKLLRALPEGADIGYLPSLVSCLVSGGFSAYTIANNADVTITEVAVPSTILVVCSEIRVFSYYRRTPVLPLAAFALYRSILYTFANALLVYKGTSNDVICPTR